jgi:small ligand-binding sensory domain FIST
VTSVRWVSIASDLPDLGQALAACAHDVSARLGGQFPDLLLAFASREHLFQLGEIVPTLQRLLHPGALLGCSAGGVIGGGRELEQTPGLTLTAALLPDVRRRLVHLTNEQLPPLDGSPRRWVEAIGVEPAEDPAFVVLADPFSCDAHRLLQGLDFAYPKAVKVGGLASGAQSLGGNALFADQRTLHGGAVVLALTGNLEVDTIVAQGCRPIGRTLRITACEQHTLQTLDGRPALEVLQEIYEGLSDRDQQLVQHALFLGLSMDGLRDPAGPGDFLIRNLVGIHPQTGVIGVAGELRPGQTVQFHVRDGITAAEDLDGLLQRYRRARPAGGAQGALLFSCLGRGEHLYGEPDHDSRAFARGIGDVPVGGFFCNGEIGPVGGTTYLHGYTSAFGIFRPRRP